MSDELLLQGCAEAWHEQRRRLKVEPYPDDKVRDLCAPILKQVLVEWGDDPHDSGYLAIAILTAIYDAARKDARP